MTDCATIPRWCLPIAVPDDEWELEISFSAGPSPDFTATILAGAYYMDGSGDAFDLIAVTAAALNAADGGGTWTADRDEERIRFVRDGAVGDVLSFGWPSADVAQIYGYDDDPLEIIENDERYEQKGLFRARYCWTPDEFLEEDDVTPVAEAVGAITPDGDAVVDGLGERGVMNHVMRFVPAALVKQSYTDQAGYAAYVGDSEHGADLNMADPNAALQKFWTFARVLAGPVPPVIRYAADRDTPDSFKNCIWPEVEFLKDFDGVAVIDQRQPLSYRVKIRGQLTSDEVVRPSGAWSDVCDGGGEPTEYDTLWLAAQTPLDSVIIVNQTAAGNAPEIAYKAVRVDEPWFFEPHPMAGNRWLPGKIDSEVGAPGSGRFLIYRAQSSALFSINASLHLDVTHTSALASIYWFYIGTTGYPTVGVEVALPTPRGASIDVCLSSRTAPGAVSTLMCGGCIDEDWLGLTQPISTVAATIQSFGVSGGVSSNTSNTTPNGNVEDEPIRFLWSAAKQTLYGSGGRSSDVGYITPVGDDGVGGIGAAQDAVFSLIDAGGLVRPFAASYFSGVSFDWTIETIGAVNPMIEQGFGGVPT